MRCLRCAHERLLSTTAARNTLTRVRSTAIGDHARSLQTEASSSTTPDAVALAGVKAFKAVKKARQTSQTKSRSQPKGKATAASHSERRAAILAKLESLAKALPGEQSSSIVVQSVAKVRATQGRTRSTAPAPAKAHPQNAVIINTGTIEPAEIELDRIEALEEIPYARLQHGLNRVLFNPGIHWLQDPRTGVYNYEPHLKHIPGRASYNANRISQFVPPSGDKSLRTLADKHDALFRGSTSSLVPSLVHFWLLQHGVQHLRTDHLSMLWKDQSPAILGIGPRLPASVILRYQDGRYVIDSDKGADLQDEEILSELGHVMEKLLVTPPAEFEEALAQSLAEQNTSRDTQHDGYAYCKSGGILMRSQIDCHHPLLPKQTFDIKTRATVSVRTDKLNHEEASGYLIRYNHGMEESYEREIYDLIRNAYLKYSYQARIGGMDGIFIAYHNTKRIFGFQYISIADMDYCLNGSSEEAESTFRMGVRLFDTLLRQAIGVYPQQTLRVMTEGKSGRLMMFVRPNGTERELTKDEPLTAFCLELGEKTDNGYKYTIRKYADDENTRALYRKTATRQSFFNRHVLPPGVTPAQVKAVLKSQRTDDDDMEDLLDPVDDDAISQEGVGFTPHPKITYVDRPSKMVQAWRQIARRGKALTDSLGESDAPDDQVYVVPASEPELRQRRLH